MPILVLATQAKDILPKVTGYLSFMKNKEEFNEHTKKIETEPKSKDQEFVLINMN